MNTDSMEIKVKEVEDGYEVSVRTDGIGHERKVKNEHDLFMSIVSDTFNFVRDDKRVVK